MYYYEVLIGDLRYHGKSALTYASEAVLSKDSVVRIALRNKPVLGIVTQSVNEPAFTSKPIAAIATAPPLPPESLQLADWLYTYYPAPFGSVIRQFLPPSTAFPKTENIQTTDTPKQTGPTAPPLTTEQTAALHDIQSPGYYLLHGITGSGKTRVYIELALRTLKAGRSVILLTPEIGLTAQLIASLTTSLSCPIYVLHSRQTAAERRDVWYAILCSTEPIVVVGPRSALFAPVHNIGLIVLDESHDQAYKNESAPHYRTERVAAKLAELHKAYMISGSATPSIEEYHMAQAKKRPILHLDSLAKQTDNSLLQSDNLIVDMRERGNFIKSNILSDLLIDAMRLALTNHEQTLLFLNRRGTAGAILCNNCGWQSLCPHCDLPVTYHGDTHTVRCHICGRTWPLLNSCPECQHTELLLKSIGTKAVVEEVARLFPEARVHRFDSDIEKSDHIEQQLAELQDGSIDIIVGTQMITKGLDLPKLSVVGVLNADSSLLIPDYSANERTYQLLTQVIGRAGRGHRQGIVVVQTYNPDQPVIRAAVSQDWKTYVEHELLERKTFHFPPFTFLLKLTCARATSQAAEKAAHVLKRRLEETSQKIQIEGPSASFHPRERGKYRWQLIIKSSSRPRLVEIIQQLPSGWAHDIDPTTLL